MSNKQDDIAREDWLMRHGLMLDELDSRLVQPYFKIYTQCRRNIFPGYRGTPKKQLRLWRKFAIALHDSGLNPRAYIYSSFALYGANTYITHLVSPKTFSKIQKVMWNEQTRITCEQDLFLKKFASRLRVEKDVRVVLEMLTAELSDAFIWCVAKYNHLDDIAEQFHKRAIAQLQNPVYRDIYSKSFPEVLNTNAD